MAQLATRIRQAIDEGRVNELNDPAVVAAQYSNEQNLRARQALYEETTGSHPHDVLWSVLCDVRPRHVLEVGGGPGELAERMQNQLGATVTFVDISPRMVELARARGIDARVGDVQELPFADGSFDTSVAAWMLYHVPDIDRGISELARVLCPGGKLVAVTNSVHHLRELRDLIHYPTGREELFNRENGEQFLRRHFPQVERHDADGTVTVRERAKLVAYRDSMQVDVGPVPEDVPMPFVIHRRTSVFVATK
jgi:SAM-dependent methyltransferase